MHNISQQPTRLSNSEFISLMGMMFATIAFSVDAMLPALPEIGAELTPNNLNLAQLVLTSFMIGLGVGTLFAGPISDRFGRKPVILAGAAVYVVGAVLAWVAPTLELLLAARLLQGLGAAGPRVVTLALIRDLYTGREMARVVSFVMLVFTIFPAVAPLIGQGIISIFDWRAIFLAFVGFATLSVGWLTLRQPETLPVSARRKLDLRQLWDATTEILSVPQMRLSIIVQSLIYGVLFGVISSIQQVFDTTYGMGEVFHYLFAAMAIAAAPCAPINGLLVVRLGMRPLVRRALFAQLAAASVFICLLLLDAVPTIEVWVFFAWAVTVFMMIGFTIGNLNALALEPLGHIAGLAASIMGAISTIAGVSLGILVGLLYNGSALPLAVSTAVFAGCGGVIMLYMPREGR